MPVMQKELALVQAHSRCLFDRATIDGVLDKLANDVSMAMSEKAPLFLCVMTGAVVTTGLLLPKLSFPLELDYIHVTRYQHELTGGALRWNQKPTVPVKDRHVVIIDDVLDEGITLQAIKDYCMSHGASTCQSLVLVEKMIEKDKDVVADFVGVTTGPDYIYGMGMDYKGYLRNAPGIYACPTNLEELLCQI